MAAKEKDDPICFNSLFSETHLRTNVIAAFQLAIIGFQFAF